MTDDNYTLTRRKTLAALGTVGAASAGAGFGTSAFFSDEETYPDNALTSGELDLLVTFQEHYSDWSDDETAAVSDVLMPESGTFDETEYPGDYTGLPVANDALVAVPTPDVGAFMDATAIDAFPDTDTNGTANDGLQDDVPVDDECSYLQSRLRADGEWVSALDSPARTESHRGDPLVTLSDVKPGDFGEVIFGLHLCDNPGYLWASGRLRSNAENGLTEPEADDPEENGGEPGELADVLEVALWYDTGANGTFFETDDPDTEDDDTGEGDNVRQDYDNGAPADAPERLIAKGTLSDVMSFLNLSPGVPLDASPDALLHDATSPSEGTSTTASGSGTVSGDAETSARFSCATVGGNPRCSDYGLFSAVKDDDPQSGDTHSTPPGTVTFERVGDGTATISTDFPVAAVILKGGPVARVCLADGDSDGTSLEEGDGVVLDSAQFRTATNPNNGKRYGVSHIQVCYDVAGETPSDGNGARECFPASDTAHVGFAWWLPLDHGNEIQSDAVAFDLGFYAEQCRHNDGSGMAPETASE